MTQRPELPVQTLENKYNGVQALRLTSGPFEGIIYTYGKVSFDENEVQDNIKFHFEYDIWDNAGKEFTDPAPFEKYIGDILVEMIHRGLEDNNITYTGGVDANRTEDPEQSSS